jgi:hypothetical protein
MSILANFVCWHCRAEREVEIPYRPHFAFELAAWANDAGMYGVIDHYHGRSLIFCNEDHANNEKTKAGHFRMRPKGPAKTKEQSHG